MNMAIQTINTSDVGTDFIDKLNDNFAECVTGGSSDGSVTVKVPMQGGDLKTATGQVDGRWCTGTSSFTWTDDNYYKYIHTPLYLSLKNNKVKQVAVPTGNTLSIFCYDEALSLISNGVVNDVDNIPDGTAYVKFQLYNASGYTQVPLLEVTLTAQPEWVKNVATPLVPQWFNYDCKPPKMWDDANYTTPHEMPTDGTADIDNTRYHDNGCIILPPNYTPDGEPCKVMIWFNGDNCPWFVIHDTYHRADGTTSPYESLFKYAAANGLAIAMCSGYTSMWKDEQGAADPGLWVGRLTPAYIASVRALYDRIMDNYNLDPQVYIAGKSAGGYMLLHTAMYRPFPVRAAAGMSVGLGLLGQFKGSYLGTKKTILKRCGITGWNSYTTDNTNPAYNGTGASAAQITDANNLAAAKDIIKKYDPWAANCDLDWPAWVTAYLSVRNTVENGAMISSLQTLIDASMKVCTTPLKLWCATEDTAVSYPQHKSLVDWIVRSGGIAEMRSYTGSDGDHSTFDGTAHAATVATPYSGSMTAPLGIVEAVEWFKRW